MTIHITPESGVEITPQPKVMNLLARAEAACQAAALLEHNGLEIEVTEEDKDVAATLTKLYAEDAERTSKLVNDTRASTLTPASLVTLRTYLDEYGRSVVAHSIELRNYVTNRLLEESMNADPRIRIKALELLGKHSDVGLFTEKQEVTITHQSTDELRERLRDKLRKLVHKGPAEIIPAEEVQELPKPSGNNE